jgi:hypothetical protein
MWDPTGHIEVGLREYAESLGGKVSWNNDTRTASIIVNGVNRNIDINDYKVENGHIKIDSTQVDKAQKSSVTLFQHGVNSDSSSLAGLTITIANKFSNVVDLGTIQNGKVIYNNDASNEKLQNALKDDL